MEHSVELETNDNDGDLEEADPSWLRRFWREWAKPLLIVAFVILSFRSAVADWNDVPTGSMKPTILEGDRIFVNKLAYDLKVPFTRWRIAAWGGPKRGDVAVLFSPADGTRLVKRIIGLPGDRIELNNQRLTINGEAVAYEAVDAGSLDVAGDREMRLARFSEERLDAGVHRIMTLPIQTYSGTFGPIAIPDGHYFVMGDNRDNSLDSRFFGVVPRDAIVGRATNVVLSFEPDSFLKPRWGRFFTRLP